MEDTTPEIKALIHQKLMALSMEERLLMGSRSFDAAREFVLASLPKDLPALEFRRKQFERIYGNQFSEIAKLIR